MRDVIAQAGEARLNLARALEGSLGVGQDVVLADVFYEIGALRESRETRKRVNVR